MLRLLSGSGGYLYEMMVDQVYGVISYIHPDNRNYKNLQTKSGQRSLEIQVCKSELLAYTTSSKPVGEKQLDMNSCLPPLIYHNSRRKHRN